MSKPFVYRISIVVALILLVLSLAIQSLSAKTAPPPGGGDGESYNINLQEGDRLDFFFWSDVCIVQPMNDEGTWWVAECIPPAAEAK